MTIWGINVLGRGKKKYKCPEWRVCPVSLRNSQKTVFLKGTKCKGEKYEMRIILQGYWDLEKEEDAADSCRSL